MGRRSGSIDKQEQIVEFCQRFGAREVLQAASAEERELLWKCRKMAVGATGRLSPSYTIQDGVVPRTKLPAHHSPHRRNRPETQHPHRQRRPRRRRQRASDPAVR